MRTGITPGPGLHGVAVADSIRSISPGPPVLVHSNFNFFSTLSLYDPHPLVVQVISLSLLWQEDDVPS